MALFIYIEGFIYYKLCNETNDAIIINISKKSKYTII